jgi:hypothetical protein
MPTATEPVQGATRPSGISDKAREKFQARLEATRNAEATRLALVIAKRVDGDVVVCPACGRPAPRGKFKIHPDGGWKHFSRTGCHGDAVSVLQHAGVSTSDAVRALNGLPTRTPLEIPDDAAELAAAFVGVRSKVDLEVFNGILVYGRRTGGVAAAQEFYGTWHISPQAVEDLGAVYITDPKHFAAAILERFGEERLLACGLFVRTEKGRLYCLISSSFPVVEPHRHPATGDVLYMQLRGSHAQHARYLAHKADPDNVPYKGHEKFISLKGAPRTAQIGCGLDLVERLPHGSTVVIVEGFKDALAGRTLGMNTYGIPGVDFRPSEKICKLLARHRVLVATDGDEAGVLARDGGEIRNEAGKVIGHKEGLVGYLRRHGVDAHPQSIGPGDLGLDVTDYLVATHASGKATGGTPCACPACDEMRAKHPDWFGTT